MMRTMTYSEEATQYPVGTFLVLAEIVRKDIAANEGLELEDIPSFVKIVPERSEDDPCTGCALFSIAYCVGAFDCQDSIAEFADNR
jgi:hypothetical protein